MSEWGSQKSCCDRSVEPERTVATRNRSLTLGLGAGSGGASTAYYLHQFAAPCKLNITVYERSDYIGGRSTTIDVFDDPSEPVELGASIFVKVNHNLVSAVERFNLSTKSYRGDDLDGLTTALGVWDGQRLVFLQNDANYSWWNTVKILWKYGLSPIRTQNLMKATVNKFLLMYGPPFFPFASIGEVVRAIGLTAVSTPSQSFLEENRIYAPFSSDIIQASTRVNYAQNLDQIHGLEAMVCMAADGAMSIHGGNWQIFDRMLKSSSNNVRLDTEVTDISLMADGETYTVKSTSVTDSAPKSAFIANTDTFDTVVIATPLQFSNITINPPPSIYQPSPIPYVTLHVTLFTSPQFFEPESFNLSPGSTLPTVVLTTLPEDGLDPPQFFSISTLRSITNPNVDPPRREYLYKVFSPGPLDVPSLTQILKPSSKKSTSPPLDVTWQYHKVWHSYPYLPPRITFDEPQLDEGGKLWYTSGIEPFISTMETSSLMGMNVAQLIVDRWRSDSKRERSSDNENISEGTVQEL